MHSEWDYSVHDDSFLDCLCGIDVDSQQRQGFELLIDASFSVFKQHGQ